MARQHTPNPDDLELAYELGYQDGHKSASPQNMGDPELRNAYASGWLDGRQCAHDYNIRTVRRRKVATEFEDACAYPMTAGRRI